MKKICYSVLAHDAALVSFLIPYLAKDENRPSMAFISLAQGRLRVTDGKRALDARAPEAFDDIPEGLYRPVKDGKEWLLVGDESGLLAPNVELAMPKSWKTQFPAVSGTPNLNSVIAANVARVAGALDSDFVNDLPPAEWTVGINGPEQGVLFFNEQFMAVIMPISKWLKIPEAGDFKLELTVPMKI